MSDMARGAGKRVELSGLRRGTVRSMSMSAVVPQFTLQRDISTAGLREVRKALKSGEHRATLTDVITMACARALREHPGVNASYGEDCVIEHERVNIGLALALDDGLTVPVIMDADVLSLEGLAVGAAAAGRGGAHASSCAQRRSSPARSASRTSGRSASTASSPWCCLRRPRSWPSARCATPSASRRRSITAPWTAPPGRASSRRSPAC